MTRNIAKNICKRKEKSNVSLEEIFNVETREPSPENIVVANDTLRRLVNAIERLSPTYRDVLKLKYLNQLKEYQIAALLDLPQKTVNQRIFRGKALLRKSIEEENLNE